MAHNDLTICESKSHLLKIFIPRIEQLFGVRVKLGEHGSSHSTTSEGARKVHISTTDNSDDKISKACQYIVSVTAGCQVVEELHPDVFKQLLLCYDEIERLTQVILSFQDDGCTVHLSGTPKTIEKAQLILRKLSDRTDLCERDSDKPSSNFDSLQSQPSCTVVSQYESDIASPTTKSNLPCNQSLNSQTNINKHMLLVHTLSPGADSNPDSCYDSDNSPSRSRRNSGAPHSDVSRTVSDTLGAEHDDHGAKVKFALKLGYTEQQLQEAFDRIGQEVSENELLNELIKLGRHNKDDEDEDSEDVNDNIITHVEEETNVPSHSSNEDKGTTNSESSYNLRHIVIDGSNVAMSHGNKEVFSCRGIHIAVNWFQERGHKEITVFVPQWRKEASRPDAPIKDQDILLELERQQIVVFTPARRVGGKRVVCYDDRYVIKLAAQCGGIVVSNDNYRDLIKEDATYKKVIEERLLMYSFVNDHFMPPDDPLGRHGPSLDHFLMKDPPPSESLPQLCPYAKKCTYGNKCKFYHPERGSQPHKSVTEKLQEQTSRRIREAKDKGLLTHTTSLGDATQKITKRAVTSSRSVPSPGGKKPLSRTKSVIPQPAISITEPESQKEGKGAGSHLPPDHWSLAKPDLLSVRGTSKASQESPITGGHLALAKKLSDEGIQNPAPSEVPNRHQKLERQLSLRGSEDPRLQPHPAVYNPGTSSTLSNEWYRKPALISALPRNLIADSPTPSQQHPVSTHRPLEASASLGRQELGLPHHHLMPPEQHIPLGRMSSAPVSLHSLLPTQQQHTQSNVCKPLGDKMLTRQNSTSDPQITSTVNDPCMQSVYGDPRWRYTQEVANPAKSIGLSVIPDLSQHPSMLPDTSKPPPLQHYQHLMLRNSPPEAALLARQTQLEAHSRTSSPQAITDPAIMINASHQSQAQHNTAVHSTNHGMVQSTLDSSMMVESHQIQETRKALYFHLCGLFPKEKVLKVMNQHPDELEAKNLCLYIMSLP